MNATITVVCYQSKTLKNGEHPLMLRITKDRKRKFQSLGISVNPKHWDFVKNRPKANCPNRDQIQKIILEKQAKLQSSILEFNAEDKTYTSATLLNAEKNKFQEKTVKAFYMELLEQYKNENKCGNRLIYKGSLNSLTTFTRNRLDIPFSVIDVDWLTKYEKWPPYLINYNSMKTDFKVAEVQLTYKNRIPIKDRQSIHSSTEAYNLVKHHFPDETIDYRESFKALFTNKAGHTLGCLTISEGGPCCTAVDVKLILQGALLMNACGVILAHNHPSGNLHPSALDTMDIKLLDHLIVTRDGYFSFANEDLI